MKEIILGFHILGAILLFSQMGVALIILLKNKLSFYKTLAMVIGGLGMFEIITGSLLSVITSGSITNFCMRVGAYIGAILFFECLLAIKMKSQKITYPGYAISFFCAVTLLTVVFSGITLLTS